MCFFEFVFVYRGAEGMHTFNNMNENTRTRRQDDFIFRLNGLIIFLMVLVCVKNMQEGGMQIQVCVDS